MSYLFRGVCLVLFCLSAHSVNADPVTYTFEAPVFFSNEIVPLTNRAPNSGPDTFRASFTSTGTPTGPFRIASVPHPSFTGQSLFNPTIPASLTVSFNLPVNHVQISFGMSVPGVLTLTSSVGSISQDSAVLGGNFHGGTIVFSSAIPFTSFTLEGFNLASVPAPILFGIDNLTMTVVPEPTTILLLSCGLIGIAARARIRYSPPRGKERRGGAEKFEHW